MKYCFKSESIRKLIYKNILPEKLIVYQTYHENKLL